MKPLQDATQAEIQAALLEVINRHKDEIRAAAPYLQALSVGHEQYQRIYKAVDTAETLDDIVAACNTPAELSLARSVMEQIKASRAQSKRASGERTDKSVARIIRSIAKWDDTKPMDRWHAFVKAMHKESMHPSEGADTKGKPYIRYELPSGEIKQMGYRSFLNRISKARKQALSR